MLLRPLAALVCVGVALLGYPSLGVGAALTSDASITKVDDKGGSSITSAVGSLVAGQPITYTIIVSNSGPDAASALQVTDNVLSAHPGVVTSDTWTVASGLLVGTLHTFSLTGDETNGSTVITSVASTTGMLIGSTITGPGVPAGTTVANLSATTITMSAAATATAAGVSLQVSSQVVTDLPSTTGLSVGQPVAGTGIPAGAVIVSIDSGTQITMNAIATTNGPQSLTFGATFITGGPSSGSGDISTRVDLSAGASVAFVVTANTSPTATGTLSNTATVAVPPGDATPADNTATDTDTLVVPDLAITKTHPGSFAQGQFGASYTLHVANVGTGTAAGTITVTDTLPAGLSFVSGTGAGWGCSAIGQTVTCTSTTPLAPGASSDITLTVNVAVNAPANLVNGAAVACSCTETNFDNNSSSDPTAIGVTAVPALDGRGLLLLGLLLLGVGALAIRSRTP